MRLRTRANYADSYTGSRHANGIFVFSIVESALFAFNTAATAIIPARLYRLATDKHNRRPK